MADRPATWRRAATGLAVAGLAAAILSSPALAQSSLGIGAAEPSFAPTGPLASLLQWINVQQQSFYRALTEALKAMRQDGSGLWMLVGLSFAYGVFHAAGPGHGKAVISSYMFANEVALRRGVVLSFAAAALQALSAIVLMSTVFLVLRGTAISMTDAASFLETASFALVAAFGAWLLWRKIMPLIRPRPAAHSLSAASIDHNDHDHAHHHAEGEVCPSCGHSHAPDPEALSDGSLDWKTAWSAVAAVGIRPCSGALIVLTFSFLNALWLGGIISVLAMALGTAITVSALAILAVTAKNWAVALAGGGKMGNGIHAAIEIAGALVVFLLGLTLLAASLS
ncbi:nickel/cobalt transporter [Nitratireductor luteus]|uniref:nickel/cobalt transporter n=1 Tax=Nitratireductor luteus TaxID=2976980 RepID=UPI00223FB7C6|nr:nickel/cobalt transporter [Nitratireductor luteus]